MFSYEKNGKIHEFKIEIGKEWSKQEVKNQELNTIFNMIDDGDGVVSENEFNIFTRLFKIIDGTNDKKQNKVIEKSELLLLIDKIKNKEIELPDLLNKPEETYDENKYSVENLKKRYPESKYEYKQSMSTQLCIIDKKTGLTVLELIKPSRSEKNSPCAIYTITEYDKNGKEQLFTIYGNDNQLQTFKGKDGIRHEVLPENLYAEISKKTLGFIPTTGKNLEKYLNQLNKHNIENIMAIYKDLSGSSLISDILTERGLDSELRAKYVKQIIDTWLDARETKYAKKIDNFREAFYKLIEKEKNGLTPMSAKRIESLMKQIEDIQHVSDGDITIRSEEKENARKANGKIDSDFEQGTEGDCWLLAAIKSIMNNPAAKSILEDQISVDKNGSVTINLKFVGKKYTFTKEEIEKRNDLSDGDMDVRALEMAVEKYFEEESWTFEIRSLFSDDSAIDSNNPNRAYEILLGKGGSILNRTLILNKFITKGFIDDIKEGKYIATVWSMELIKEYSDFTVEDNNGVQHNLRHLHAYAVIGADENYVYVVNPWDTSSTLLIPTDKFLSFFDCAGTFNTEDINKQLFGEDAIVKKDGRVFIPSKANGTMVKDKEGHGKRYVSKNELLAIKTKAEEKYGKNYKVSVNDRGDILLTPKEINQA